MPIVGDVNDSLPLTLAHLLATTDDHKSLEIFSMNDEFFATNLTTKLPPLADIYKSAFDDDCVFHPTFDNYIMIVSFCLIFCASVVGNSVVVVVILQNRSMRSVTNLYLLNLALSDLLLSVVCMPPTLVSSLVYCWVFGDVLCKLLAYLQPMVVTASSYTLAAIAVERYYAICRPLQSRVWHTKRHAIGIITLVWLVSIIANLGMLFMYEEKVYGRNGINCAPRYSAIVHFGYQIYMTVVLLLVPLLTMIWLYSSVIVSLREGIQVDISAVESNYNSLTSSPRPMATDFRPLSPIRNGIKSYSMAANGQQDTGRKSKSSAPLFKSLREASPLRVKCGGDELSVEQRLRSTHSVRNALAKQRLIRMLIVIVIIFFCCWTPSYIWWILLGIQDSFGSINVWNSELNTLITVLTYFSSCTNPITYCFLNSKFRNALFLTFGGGRRRSKGSGNLQRMANSAAAANQKLTSERRNNVVKWNNLSLSSSHRSEEMTPTVAMEKDQMSANCGWCLNMLSRMKNAVLSNCVNSSSSPTSTKSAEGYWAVISTKESGTRSWNLRNENGC